jgi:hypothetical protein
LVLELGSINQVILLKFLFLVDSTKTKISLLSNFFFSFNLRPIKKIKRKEKKRKEKKKVIQKDIYLLLS